MGFKAQILPSDNPLPAVVFVVGCLWCHPLVCRDSSSAGVMGTDGITSASFHLPGDVTDGCPIASEPDLSKHLPAIHALC